MGQRPLQGKMRAFSRSNFPLSMRKSLVFDPQKPITETLTSHPDIGEQYIALTAHDAASFLHIAGVGPQLQEGTVSDEKGVEELHFLPYVLRDNRGGKGHMRVGLRRK